MVGKFLVCGIEKKLDASNPLLNLDIATGRLEQTV